MKKLVLWIRWRVWSQALAPSEKSLLSAHPELVEGLKKDNVEN
jgi:hypothetical protein